MTCPQEAHFNCKDTDTKWRAGEGYSIANVNQSKAGVAILISDKADFRSRKIIRGKEGHYIIMKDENEKSLICMRLTADWQNMQGKDC